jgi:hypothetical protein
MDATFCRKMDKSRTRKMSNDYGRLSMDVRRIVRSIDWLFA